MCYQVKLKKSEEGYAVWCPGCRSQGETEKEALDNIKDAIMAFLETVEEIDKDGKSRYVEVG